MRDSSYRQRMDLWTLPRHREAKSVSFVSFSLYLSLSLFLFFLRSLANGSPISFSRTLSVRPREHGLFSRALPMQPRCGRSCHCSGDRYPSSRLRAKVTTLYLESQLMPPPLSRDHPLIIDEPLSAPPFLRSFCGIYRWLLTPSPSSVCHCSPTLRESA